MKRLFMLAMLAGCAGSVQLPATTPADGLAVVGAVIDEATGRPVRPDSVVAATGRVERSGATYVIRNIERVARIDVFAAGYYPERRSSYFYHCGRYSPSAPCTDTLTFRMRRIPRLTSSLPTCDIVGTVTAEATGKPLDRVQVSVDGTNRGAITDERGRFRITAVPAGRQNVRAQAIGHLTERRTLDVACATEAAAVELDFRLMPARVQI